MKEVQIFKENADGLVRMEEVDLIMSRSPRFKYYTDRANGYVAFALFDITDRDEGDSLVYDLNEIGNGEFGYWYLGAEGEEYVNVL